MNIKKFENLVDRHSLEIGNFNYNGNALGAEAGEALNLIKKIHMARKNPEWVAIDPDQERSLKPASVYSAKLRDELGDALFYLTRIAKDAGLTLE